MPPKKKKKPHKSTVNFTTANPLPQRNGAGKNSPDPEKKFKANRATLSMQNASLFIIPKNKHRRVNKRATIQTRNRQELIGRTRIRNCQHSKQINQSLRGKRKYWNKTKIIWKQWYISRGILNAKFKAISKYFGSFIRRRRPHVPFRQQKALGKKPFKPRAVRRARRARRRKQRNKRKEMKKKKWKRTLLKGALKYNRYGYRRNTSEVPKLKFITVDALKTIMCQSKTKEKSRSTMIVERSIGESYEFPLCPWIERISIDTNKFVTRYYNQHIFIYAASIGTKRPLQRNLVYTLSTLNENEIE